MLCKKCGAEIADNAKFCGHCGEIIEAAPIVNEPQNVEENVNNVVKEPIVNENELGNTVVVEPIISENLNQPEINQVNEPVQESTPSEPNNKKGKVPFLVIGGVILAIVAIIVLVFAFTNNSSNSVEVLKKSLANFESGYDSATIEAKMSMASAGTSLEFSAAIKTQKINDKKTKLQITVNPSMLFEEMNVYAEIEEKELIMYLESTLIDMLGTTSSLTPSWIKYSLKLDELMKDEKVDEKLNDIKLEDVIDEKHFTFIDKVEDLNHYQLIIDQELIQKLEEINGEKIDEIEPLEKAIKIDFYISKSNEITKVELDMSDYLNESDSISSLALSLEIKDLNNTQIVIPTEALNTTTDLETYMANNAISQDGAFDSGFDTELDTDFDTNFDTGLDTDFDTDFDTGFDFDTDWNY